MDVPHNLQHIQALTEKIVDYVFISFSIPLVIHYLLHYTSLEKFHVNITLHEFHVKKIEWKSSEVQLSVLKLLNAVKTTAFFIQFDNQPNLNKHQVLF